MFGVQAPWSESLHVVLFSVPSAKLTVLSSLGFCTFHIFACASQYMATWWAPCTRGSCLPWGSQVKLGRGCRCLNRTQGKSLATSSSCLSMCLFFMFLTMLSVGPELFLLCPFAKHEIAVLAIQNKSLLPSNKDTWQTFAQMDFIQLCPEHKQQNKEHIGC